MHYLSRYFSIECNKHGLYARVLWLMVHVGESQYLYDKNFGIEIRIRKEI